MRILLKTPLNAYTGYGNDGIGLAMALLRWGISVQLDPEEVKAPIPHQLAKLLTEPVKAPFDLIVQHGPPDVIACTPAMSASATATIGWSMWETTTLEPLQRRDTFGGRTERFDALLAYDPVSADAFRGETTAPVSVLQGGFAAEDWKPIQRDWFGTPFRFGMVGALSARKDPFAAIRAFKDLREQHEDFAAGAELHLKTSTPGMLSQMEDWLPGLKIHNAVWDHKQMEQFYAATHVLVAPSRGEGKNVPALEHLATGGTVIASNWGGHTGWLTPDIGYPVMTSLVPFSPDFPSSLWAEVHHDDLKAKMLDAFRDRAGARRRGELAERTIEPSCSWDAVVRRFVLKLPSLLSDGRGAALKALADAAHREVEFQPRFERTPPS
jgi:glycosyltransferase involved in cell wall biosynthesis